MARRTVDADEGRVPGWWEEVSRIQKTLLAWPEWSDPPPPRSKSPFSTTAAETTEVVIPLGNEQGIGMQGVQLRMNAWAYKRHHELTATLEAGRGGRSSVAIARVDAWPADPHTNSLVRTNPQLKGTGLPLQIQGCHIHRFSDNARLGSKAFTPLFNLPIAAPVPEPLTSFRGFLRTVEREFVITGLEGFPPPPWQERLL